MPKKNERRTGAEPDSHTFRVVIRTIKVRNEVWKRSLADVLADPPTLPPLTRPAHKDQEKEVQPVAQIARAAGG